MTHPNDGESKAALPRRAHAPKCNTVTSAELMGAAKELVILHDQGQYLLRITSNGKLILTK